MKDSKAAIASNLGMLSSALSLAFKIGAAIGGGCLLFYCHKLNYFPTNISLGDAAFFALLAVSFGIVYILFIACIMSVGVCFVWPLLLLQKPVVWLSSRFGFKRKYKHIHSLRPDVVTIPLAFIGAYVVYAMGKQVEGSTATLIATCILLGFSASILNTIQKEVAAIKTQLNSVIQLTSNTRHRINRKYKNIKNGQLLMLGVIIVLPLFVAGVSGRLLNSSMRFAGVRKAPDYILVKSPYDKLIPSSLDFRTHLSIPGYTPFQNVVIAFSGIGERTVLQYSAGNQLKTVYVPSGSVIAVSANKSLQRTPLTGRR